MLATWMVWPPISPVWPSDFLTGGHCDPHLNFLLAILLTADSNGKLTIRPLLIQSFEQVSDLVKCVADVTSLNQVCDQVSDLVHYDCRCHVIDPSVCVWPSVWSSSPCFVADVTSLIQAFRSHIIDSSVWPSVWSSSPCFVVDVTSLIQACDQVSDLVRCVLFQMSHHWSKRVTKCLI